jgi:hypothetical protein
VVAAVVGHGQQIVKKVSLIARGRVWRVPKIGSYEHRR